MLLLRLLRVGLLVILVSTVLPIVTVSNAAYDGSPLASKPSVQPAGDQPVRALWVDAFHDGIKSPEQVKKLVADARRANVNTLLVQVRRRGDLYYPGGPEPTAPDLTAGFDALRAVIEAARAESPRIEVQAWLSGYIVGNGRALPNDPRHLLHRHGPNAVGEENWLMRRDDGEQLAGDSYWLDPGHPRVQLHLTTIVADLVQRYAVDGVHLDRLRYYEGDAAGGGLVRRWGYNPQSVIRFDLENGRIGQPDPSDPAWMQARRDRVTELLRRFRDVIQSIRPGTKLSAAVVPWGPGPESDADWTRSAAYSQVFQDWRFWLAEGLLDQAYVMNYNRENAPNQSAWLDRWLAYQRRNSSGRQVIAGLALYLNEPADSLKQIRRALAPGADGSRLAGVALYSYAAPDPTRGNTDLADDSADGVVWDLLARSLPANDFNPPFADASSVVTKAAAR